MYSLIESPFSLPLKVANSSGRVKQIGNANGKSDDEQIQEKDEIKSLKEELFKKDGVLRQERYRQKQEL